MGFCRTNLFKRLESSGAAFQQSIERHILRNYIFLHAIENGLPLPIGTQDAGLLDAGNYDEDVDDESAGAELFEEDRRRGRQAPARRCDLRTADDFRKRAADVYERTRRSSRAASSGFGPTFSSSLGKDLRTTPAGSTQVSCSAAGEWDPDRDAKLEALLDAADEAASERKDHRLHAIRRHGALPRDATRARGCRGSSPASRASPTTPPATPGGSARSATTSATASAPDEELRVLLATDVLSEGQNLQDGAIIVNYDLPWAIIRLIQRAGRVDRIGQKSEKILCYSFLPADGVEQSDPSSRTRAAASAGECRGGRHRRAFFEDERERQKLLDLYNEKAGILDGEDETEVDLASYAYQIWKNAIDRYPELQKTIPALPPVVYLHATASSLRRASRTASWSTCARPKATTRWPGSTRMAITSRNRSSRF